MPCFGLVVLNKLSSQTTHGHIIGDQPSDTLVYLFTAKGCLCVLFASGTLINAAFNSTYQGKNRPFLVRYFVGQAPPRQ